MAAAAARKRGRDDDDGVEEAVELLAAAMSRDSDVKLSAMSALQRLIDPGDEAHAIQRRAVGAGVLALLPELLRDRMGGVRLDAARLLCALVRHSAPVQARLAARTTALLSHAPERLCLNPVQEAVLEEADGAIELLTGMRLTGSATEQAAAADALAALVALHRPNAVAALAALVECAQDGVAGALPALDAALAGFDGGGISSVRSLVVAAAAPALAALQTPRSPSDQLDALTLLGTLAEMLPPRGSTGGGGAAQELSGGMEAVPAVAAALVQGDVLTRDAAARALWQLVRHDRQLLRPGAGALGVPGPRLVPPLLALLETAEGQQLQGDSSSSDGDDGCLTCSDGHTTAAAAAVADASLAVDNADDALALLRALADADADVRDALCGREDVLQDGGRCVVM